MSNEDDFVYREFTKNNARYLLGVTKPYEVELECWSVTVSFSHSHEVIWSHEVFGVDGVQALFLGLDLARVLLEHEGGYLYLDQSDLQLTRDMPPNTDQD